MFMGDMISLVPTVGLFVTMNPGKREKKKKHTQTQISNFNFMIISYILCKSL